MSKLELETYEMLKDKLGDQEASNILRCIDEIVEQKFLEKKKIFLTKDDKIDLIKWWAGLWIAFALVISIVSYFKGH